MSPPPLQPPAEDFEIQLTPDDFQDWLDDMDEELDGLKEQLPDEMQGMLDFTPASLTRLEALLLDEFETVEEVMDHSEGVLLDRLARYVGQVAVRAAQPAHQDAGWTINLEEPDEPFYQIPVVHLGDRLLAPAELILHAVDAGTGEVIEPAVLGLDETDDGADDEADDGADDDAGRDADHGHAADRDRSD